MSRIMTCSHKMFDPLAPEKELIDITDIAHALSMLCRANGHFRSFYSVGMHSINCAKEAIARGYSRRVQLACLLHDASEAYLSDVTRPVKEELPQYKLIEKPLQDVIWNKFLGSPVTPEEEELPQYKVIEAPLQAMIWEKFLDQPLTQQEEDLVFAIDDDVLENEFPALMGAKLRETVPQLSCEAQYCFESFLATEQAFLDLFRCLTQ